MKVLFLCGGIGKRMAPLTQDKFLLRFLGKTLLQHQIEMAARAGLNDMVLVCNPENRLRVEEVASELSGVTMRYAVQERPKGMANAVESAARLLDNETLVVNPNDIFEQTAYEELLRSRAQNRASSYITGHRVSSYFPGGYLAVDSNGELTHIVEKPGEGNEPSDLVNLVVHLHTDTGMLLDHISRVRSDQDDRYERALDGMCGVGKGIHVVPYSGAWLAIKYPWHILEVVRFLLAQSSGSIAPSARISDRAVIDGKVIIGEGARVLENAVLRGPVYVGSRTVIGNGALVRDNSDVGEDCVVGFGTEIKTSYIQRGSFFHMSYVGDSVIGERCNFAAGTITANWRFDEKKVSVDVEGASVDTKLDKFGAIIGDDCRTGINVSIMPGVKIASDALILPGAVVYRDTDGRKQGDLQGEPARGSPVKTGKAAP